MKKPVPQQDAASQRLRAILRLDYEPKKGEIEGYTQKQKRLTDEARRRERQDIKLRTADLIAVVSDAGLDYLIGLVKAEQQRRKKTKKPAQRPNVDPTRLPIGHTTMNVPQLVAFLSRTLGDKNMAVDAVACMTGKSTRQIQRYIGDKKPRKK